MTARALSVCLASLAAALLSPCPADTVCGLEEVGTLITDFEPDEAWKGRLEEAGVKLLY